MDYREKSKQCITLAPHEYTLPASRWIIKKTWQWYGISTTTYIPGAYMKFISSTICLNLLDSMAVIDKLQYKTVHIQYLISFKTVHIQYWNHVMIIDDPDSCLPRWFLNQHFTLMDSPFHLSDINVNITLYNCSNDPIYVYGRYPCLSGDNITFCWTAMGQCREIITAPLFDGSIWPLVNILEITTKFIPLDQTNF